MTVSVFGDMYCQVLLDFACFIVLMSFQLKKLFAFILLLVGDIVAF